MKYKLALILAICLFASKSGAEYTGPPNTNLFPSPGGTPGDLVVVNPGGTGVSDGGKYGWLNVTAPAYGAVGNTLNYSDGTVAASSTAFSSAAATFTAADIGKSITVDGAGTNGLPFVTTIAGFSDSHDVTLANPAVTATATNSMVQWAFASTPQSGVGSYAPGDTVTLAGGTASIPAIVTVRKTLVQSVAQNANGSSGTATNGTSSGTCVVYGTTGAGVKFAWTVTLTTGAISAVGAVITGQAGQYTTNPTALAAEPVIGCGALSGATLALTMGVASVDATTRGVYSVTNTSLTQASTSGSGTGATFTVNFVTSGAFAYGHDDSSAFIAALNAVNAGDGRCLFVPAGTYRIISTLPVATASSPLCIKGDGSQKTFIRMDSSYLGNALFATSNDWGDGQYPVQGATLLTQNNTAGVHIEGLTIVGDTTAATTQNAIALYDWNDLVYMRDVNVFYVFGRALYAGLTLNALSASTRESIIDFFRATNCGNASVPCVEVTSTGVGPDGSNELQIHGMNLFAVNGAGLVVKSIVGTSRLINFFGLRVEGGASGVLQTPVAGDLITIGDPDALTSTTAVFAYGTHTASPYTGYKTIRVTGPSSSNRPANIQFVGGILGPGNGGGIAIDAGQNLYFKFANMTSMSQTNLYVGPSPAVGQEVTFDLNGAEGSLTTQIDQTSTVNVGSLTFRKLLNSSLVSNLHDGSATGGNAVGTNAIDLQGARSSATQVASGTNSIALGNTNTSSGINSYTIGSGNIASGSRTFATGFNSSDHGRSGTSTFTGGVLAVAGDAQQGTGNVKCSVSTNGGTCRLTTDNTAANSTNCFNIPNNTAYTVSVSLSAFDKTTVANSWSFVMTQGFLTRGANAASTAFTAGANTAISNGTTTGIGVAVTADTTNGCPSIIFTHPTGNTDVWDVVARIDSAEIQ